MTYPEDRDKQVKDQSPSPSGDDTVWISVGATINNRYLILAKLGEGGMGVAYKARDIRSNELVAIKMLLPDRLANAKDLLRFEREAKTASLLQHPCIAKVLGFETIEGRQPFILMEFIEGKTLAQRIEAEGQLPVEETLDIFVCVLEALAYAHSKGVLHRDIKPSNIMIPTSEGNAQSVKLLDFGIAKSLPKSDLATLGITETGDIVGSPFYMSPEQARGGKIDARSDLYSLGCALYEALTGSPPHLGSTPLATILKRETDSPISMSEASLGRNFPQSLEIVVSKLLQIDPDSRYASATDVRSELIKIRVDQNSEKLPTLKPSEQAREARTVSRFVFIIGAAALVLSGLFIILPFLPTANKTSSVISATDKQSSLSTEIEVLDHIVGPVALGESSTERGAQYVFLDAAEYRMKRRDYVKAKEMAKKSLQISQSKSPPDKLGLACALSVIATCDLYDSHAKEAFEELVPAYEMLKVTKPNSSSGRRRAAIALAKVTRDLATIHVALSHPKEAERYCKEAVETSSQAFGTESPMHIQALTTLGCFYLSDSQLSTTAAAAKAERYFREAELLAGSNPQAELATYVPQGQFYAQRGMLLPAQKALESALKAQSKLAAKQRLSSTWIRLPLAEVYDRRHEYKKAESLLEDALELSRHDSNQIMREALVALGRHYFLVGAGKQLNLHLLADDYYRRALTLSNESSAETKHELFTLHRDMANNYYAAASCGMPDGFGKAENSYRKSLEFALPATGDRIIPCAEIYALIGDTCQIQCKYSEAETALRKCVALYMKASPSHTAPSCSQCALGDTLVGQGKLADALVIYRRILADSKGIITPEVRAYILCRMGVCSKLLGKSAEASACYAKAHQLFPACVEHPSGAGHNHEIIAQFLEGLNKH
jgi:serine/threonine protein kinase